MQLFGKPNRYTLFYYFILKTLPTPQRLSRFCFFRLLSLLPKVKTDGSLAERKQKVRFDSVSLHTHFTICFLTAQPLFPPWFLYFPFISCINYIIIIIIEYHITK